MLIVVFSGQASQAVSSWDLPSQTNLKFRKSGQNSEAELRKRDVRAEVEASERRALDEKPATIARRYGEKTISHHERQNAGTCLLLCAVFLLLFTAYVDFGSGSWSKRVVNVEHSSCDTAVRRRIVTAVLAPGKLLNCGSSAKWS